MGTTWQQALAVALGAAAGALLRWQAGLRLGTWGPVPGGTLLVNLVGGGLIGLALAWFALHPQQGLWRLLLVTGFLGGLTTFSAFSGESLALLQQQRIGAALWHAGVHVVGALALATAGHALGRWLWGSPG